MTHSKSLKAILQEITTILFDVDGTLVDSNDLHAEAWMKALVKFGHVVNANEIKPWIGKGGDKILADLIGLDPEGSEAKAIGDLRAEIFKTQYVSRVKAFPCARELLHDLKAQGFQIAIATSARDDELEAILKSSGLEGIFPKSTSSDDADRSKPDPDIILAALKKTKAKASDTIMIGDTPYDIEAARAAAVACVAVRSGDWSDSSLSKAIHIYDDLAHIYSSLRDERSAIASREDQYPPS